MKNDPVCLAEIDEAEAKSQGLTSEFDGRRYYFCCDQCKEDFDRDPESYTTQLGGSADKSDDIQADDYP